jgi:signal transduction histidine kinase
VWADPERIGQVLRNLLSNAVKYSPEGSPVQLCTRREGQWVRVEVIDSGFGIHPEDLVRVFDKFGRGRNAEGTRIRGVGLGLYLSRRIVRAHGSDLTVQSSLNHGSTFGFRLEVVL